MKTSTLINTENKAGYFGQFGGAFVPPVLEEKLEKLAHAFEAARNDSSFLKELEHYQRDYTGRPSPLYHAQRMSAKLGFDLFLKREDLNHTGSHKINNTLGQILLAVRMGAKEIIAETGAGQHGVATATTAALMGIRCRIFMGKRDAERQKVNVQRIRLLGAELETTDQGTASLKDAVDAALGYYVQNPSAFYLLGSAVGPHPYPSMVRFFQSVIGREARKQMLAQSGMLPDVVIACVGGGSNAIGLFSGFVNDLSVEIHAAEGGGEGVFPGKTAATLFFGRPAVFQGTYSYCLLNDKDEPVQSYSYASGLDYPGVGPEHAFLKESGRAKYHCVTDTQAMEAFHLLSQTEGIIPAVESAHAVALASRLYRNSGKRVIVNLSGRGDKDVERVVEGIQN